MRIFTLTWTLCLGLLLGPAVSLAAGGTTDPKPESTAELVDRAIQAIDEKRYMGALAVLSRVVSIAVDLVAAAVAVPIARTAPPITPLDERAEQHTVDRYAAP